MRVLPQFAFDHIVHKIVDDDLDGYPDEHKEAFYEWFAATIIAKSDNEMGLTKAFTYGAYAHHPLTQTDRLGNPDIPFPIAFAFGDRDWLGTTGADQIVRGS